MLSIIIPTKDSNSERYKRCAEIVSESIVSQRFRLCPVVSSGDDFRFSKSVNIGLKENLDSEYFLILNDDCYPDIGAIESMISTFKKNPVAGIVGANIRSPEGKIDHLGGIFSLNTLSGIRNAVRRREYFWALKMPIIHLIRRIAEGSKKSIEAFHIDSIEDGRKIDFVTGACFLISRETIERVGFFDEEFEFRAEDADYCMRATISGLDVTLDKEATAMHEVGASGFDNGKVRRSRMHLRSKYNTSKIRMIRRQRDKQSI